MQIYNIKINLPTTIIHYSLKLYSISDGGFFLLYFKISFLAFFKHAEEV